MAFRENLKSEMEYQGLTTKELADKSGVNKRTIDHYLMSNPQEPSVTNAYKIAKALNVSVEYLVTGNIENISTETDSFSDQIKKLNRLSSEKKEAIFTLINLLHD